MRVPPKALAAMGAGVIALATPVIMKWEGFAPVGYVDLAGVKTRCWGNTSPGIVVGKRYSDEECRALLAKDIAEHAARMIPCVPAETPFEVQAAFLSAAYNVGTGAVCASKSAERLKAKDYRGACNGLLGFNKVRITGRWPKWCTPDRRSVTKDGRRYCRVQGLENRRADEHRLCLKGIA